MTNVLLLGNHREVDCALQRLAPDIHAWILTEGNDGNSFERQMGELSTVTLNALPEQIDAVFELTILDVPERGSRLRSLAQALPATVPFFVNAISATATGTAAQFNDGRPVIGISVVPGLFNRTDVVEAAPALQTTAEGAEAGIELLRTAFGLDVQQVVDRMGLVSARILSMIVNEAAFAVMEGVAEPKDIDTAMQLGTNYPVGPLAWADEIGAGTVTAILEALHGEYGEERYRPCVYLKQLARAQR